MMKRPGVSEKQAADPEHEPDFYKINEERPVPEKSEDDSILLQCTLQGGPKARMPICYGSYPVVRTPTMPVNPAVAGYGDMKMPAPAQPLQQYQAHAITTAAEPISLNAFQPAVADSQAGMNFAANQSSPMPYNPSQPQAAIGVPPQAAQMPMYSPPVAQPAPVVDQAPNPMVPPANVAAAFQASSAASQFAAGFAAATALSHQQFRNILGQALASFPTNGQQQVQPPQQVAPQQQVAPPQPPQQQYQPPLQHFQPMPPPPQHPQPNQM